MKLFFSVTSSFNVLLQIQEAYNLYDNDSQQWLA